MRASTLLWAGSLVSILALQSCSAADPDPTAVDSNMLGAGAGAAGAANIAPPAAAGTNSGATAAAGASPEPSSAGAAGMSTEPAAGGATQAEAGAGGSSEVVATGGSGGAEAVGMLDEGPFSCSQYIGAYLSMEWWNSGFEEHVDDAKWQLKWHHHGYVGEWANPDSPFWADEGDPNDDTQGSPINSPCAENSDAPDRIVMLVIDWEWLEEGPWVTGLTQLVETIKAKYPSARRIDLMTLIRCPDNQMCNPAADYGVGANLVAGRQDCYVQPYVDSAIEKVAAAYPNLVGIGPKTEAMMCAPNIDGAHLGGANNEQAAQDIATFYAETP